MVHRGGWLSRPDHGHALAHNPCGRTPPGRRRSAVQSHERTDRHPPGAPPAPGPGRDHGELFGSMDWLQPKSTEGGRTSINVTDPPASPGSAQPPQPRPPQKPRHRTASEVRRHHSTSGQRWLRPAICGSAARSCRSAGQNVHSGDRFRVLVRHVVRLCGPVDGAGGCRESSIGIRSSSVGRS